MVHKVIKTLKGNKYVYLQRSTTKGTQHVTYLGRLDSLTEEEINAIINIYDAKEVGHDKRTKRQARKRKH